MYKITIRGIVQGVSFRYYTKIKADELGVKGSVRNIDDGSVQIIAIFNDLDQKESFLRWCQMGSPASKVEEIIVEKVADIKDHTEYGSFEIVR